MLKIDWERGAAVVICAAGAVVCVVLIFKYALGVLIPFIIACIAGFLVSGPADWISRKTRLPRGLCGVVLMSLFLALICFTSAYAVNRAVSELCRLATGIGADGNGALGRAITDVVDYTSSMTARLPILRELRSAAGNGEFWYELDENIKHALEKAVNGAGEALSSSVAAFVGKLPSVFIFLTVTLIACFYFSCGNVIPSLVGCLPDKVSEKVATAGKRMRGALVSWARAYLLIMILTFAELFAGLSLLGVSYAFLLALIIALIDILPVLGAGAVLGPWAVFSFILGNRYLGFGLLILWAVISVVRQIAEPKIVGKSLGLHPLVTLFSMYAGLRLFGFAGMLLGPAAAMALRALIGDRKNKSLNNNITP